MTLQENKPYLIIVSARSKPIPILSLDKSKERFPNQMIWDMNTFLAKRFNLYQFYLSRRKETEIAIEISNSFFSNNKFLCFERLEQMYVEPDTYDETECKREHLKYKNDIPDFDTFREIYLMGTSTELNYIAIDNIEHVLRSLSKKSDTKIIKSTKSAAYKLSALCPVCVCIGDHEWMEIHISELNIRKSLVDIVSRYLTS